MSIKLGGQGDIVELDRLYSAFLNCRAQPGAEIYLYSHATLLAH